MSRSRCKAWSIGEFDLVPLHSVWLAVVQKVTCQKGSQKMSKNFVFVTTCVSAKGRHIRNMVDHCKQRDITRETFLQYVDYQSVLAEIEAGCGYSTTNDGGLRMGNDSYVSYSKSVYRGCPCVYFTWSAIEYIFVEDINFYKVTR